jgi:hypothetical protein
MREPTPAGGSPPFSGRFSTLTLPSNAPAGIALLLLGLFLCAGCASTTQTPAKPTAELARNVASLAANTSASAGRAVKLVAAIPPSTRQAAALVAAEDTQRDADATTVAAGLVPPAAEKDAEHAAADDKTIAALEAHDPIRSACGWIGLALSLLGILGVVIGLGLTSLGSIPWLTRLGTCIAALGGIALALYELWFTWWLIGAILLVCAIGTAVFELVHWWETPDPVLPSGGQAPASAPVEGVS